MNQELKTKLETLSGWQLPEHDLLEFLLGKLPGGAGVIKDGGGTWTARRPNSYGAPENKDPLHGRIGWTAETAQSAVAIMAIALFEANVLRKEEG